MCDESDKHYLLIACIDEGQPDWELRCAHGIEGWQYTEPPDEDGNAGAPTGEPGCWLRSWWDGQWKGELIHIQEPISVYPIPVKPSDDWDYENGGYLVLDAGVVS